MCIIRFGLTPAQRAELPLEVDTWLVPTALAYDKITNTPGTATAGAALMAGLTSLAARLKAAGDAVKREAALKGAQAGGNAFLRELQRVTPVFHGTLRRSERVNSISGSGTRATASIGPHTVYARFRNNGGTITVKRAKVLSNGREFFGKSVTQAGSHYMEKAVAWADGGGLDGPVGKAVDEVLKSSGL